MYCDTTGTSDPKKYGERMVARKKLGFTFFKMDVTTNFISDKPGTLDDNGVPTDKGLHHPAEEEIYFPLRGSGDMVAGLDADGKEVRHPVTPGAAFFFKPRTQVGYSSNAKEDQPHDLMLAVRSRVPGMGGRGAGR